MSGQKMTVVEQWLSKAELWRQMAGSAADPFIVHMLLSLAAEAERAAQKAQDPSV